MKKFLIRLIFLLSVLPLAESAFGFSNAKVETLCIPNIASIVPETSGKLPSVPGIFEINPTRHLSFFGFCSNSILPEKIEEIEEESNKDEERIFLEKFQPYSSYNSILNDSQFLKFSFREFSNNLSLFPSTSRLHLMLRVFII